jgi:hypothetical protein
MYYILVGVLVLLTFVLFMKALGSVLKSVITTTFFLVVSTFIILMLKSLGQPVDIFGMYKIDRFVITKYER